MTGFSEIEFISHFNLIAESQGCSMTFHDRGSLEIQGTSEKLEACAQVMESVLGYYLFLDEIPDMLLGWPV